MLWTWLIFTTVCGACIGSFLNVVIYRLPEGRSLVTPPSACPKCGQKLAWYDNVPVLGWLWLGGRCRYCKDTISVQYPVIEAATAALFAVTFWSYYVAGGQQAFAQAGLMETWPALLVHLALIAALLAATVIDSRLFIIPLPIPWTATLIALAILPAATTWWPAMAKVGPAVNTWGVGMAVGGTAGLGVALVLLHYGIIPCSFAEEQAPDADPLPEPSTDALGKAGGNAKANAGDKASKQDTPDKQPPQHGTPEEWLAHPHPRREVLKECVFLAFPLAGALAGIFTAPSPGPLPVSSVPAPNAAMIYHPAVHVAAGVVCGYLVGGATVWLTRILGTLGFGKEAMGLGDVHLLAAIGAVIGGVDAIVVFFMAPFIGLGYLLVSAGLSRLLKGQVRVVPYGPYLAAAALITMLFRDDVARFVHLMTGMTI